MSLKVEPLDEISDVLAYSGMSCRMIDHELIVDAPIIPVTTWIFRIYLPLAITIVLFAMQIGEKMFPLVVFGLFFLWLGYGIVDISRKFKANTAQRVISKESVRITQNGKTKTYPAKDIVKFDARYVLRGSTTSEAFMDMVLKDGTKIFLFRVEGDTNQETKKRMYILKKNLELVLAVRP